MRPKEKKKNMSEKTCPELLLSFLPLLINTASKILPVRQIVLLFLSGFLLVWVFFNSFSTESASRPMIYPAGISVQYLILLSPASLPLFFCHSWALYASGQRSQVQSFNQLQISDILTEPLKKKALNFDSQIASS